VAGGGWGGGGGRDAVDYAVMLDDADRLGEGGVGRSFIAEELNEYDLSGHSSHTRGAQRRWLSVDTTAVSG